jgi:hypothetical protein
MARCYGVRPSEMLLGCPVALALDLRAFEAGGGDPLNQGVDALLKSLAKR